MTSTRNQPDFERMGDQLMQRIGHLQQRRRMRRRIGIVAGVALATAAASGAAIVAQVSEQQVNRGALCYGGATPWWTEMTEVASADAFTPEDPATPLPAPAPPRTEQERAARAIDMCAGVWRFGMFEPGLANGDIDGVTEYPVPKLLACVGGGGQISVFRDEGQSCWGLGLTPPR